MVYLVKEVGASVSRLNVAASDTIMNAATIFLGLTVGATMTSSSFLNTQTIMILLGGFIAFSISIAGGIFAVKIYNRFATKKGTTGTSRIRNSIDSSF